MNKINKKGQMCNSQSLKIITLVNKNGDRNDIIKCRPITLLNTAYLVYKYLRIELNLC